MDEYTPDELARAAEYLRAQRKRRWIEREEARKRYMDAVAQLPHCLRELNSTLQALRLEGLRLNK